MKMTKYLIITIHCLVIFSISAFTQNVLLKKDQKLSTTNHTTISLVQELMGQKIEMSSTVDDSKELKVENLAGSLYEMSAQFTHLKSSSSVMGQDMSFDSDDTSSESSEYGDLMQKQMEKGFHFTVSTGGEVALLEDSTSASDDSGGMMKALGADPAQEFQLLFLSKGKLKKGDEWTDSVGMEGVKTVTHYLVKNINGNEAMIEANAVSDINKDVESQGIAVKLNMKLNTVIHGSYDLKTGILKQSDLNSTGDGQADAMNMTIPITMKITRTTEVSGKD
jgi:hypothetical protein